MRQRFEILQIADVLADIGVGAMHQRECVLEVRTDGEERLRTRQRQPQRQRRIPARAAQEHAGFVDDANHGVVVAGHDVAIVQQELVGDRCEASLCVLIADRDRLVCSVPARHDERTPYQIAQQMVHGRVRQHDADRVEPRSHPVDQGSAAPPAQ